MSSNRENRAQTTTLSGGPADGAVAVAAGAGAGAAAAAAAAALCFCFARYFVLDPRLSPREPAASMLRLRHLSCMIQRDEHLVKAAACILSDITQFRSKALWSGCFPCLSTDLIHQQLPLACDGCHRHKSQGLQSAACADNHAVCFGGVVTLRSTFERLTSCGPRASSF